MTDITVFTATYNRADTLTILYESLKRQSVRNFEWLLIDDGSTDGTEQLVNKLIKENIITIRYFKQKNSGKHAAINKAAKLAQGEWFFIVDSDDELTDYAIERVYYYCCQIQEEPAFAGAVGLRGINQEEAWTSWYGMESKQILQKNQFIDANCIEYRYKYKNEGDRAEIVKTAILRQFLFPVYDSEKFLVEGFLWLSLARAGYKFRWFNEIIYITQYLDNGLTKNINKHYRNSPKGSNAFYNLQMSFKEIPLKVRVKAAANYIRYGIYGKYSLLFMYKNISSKPLFPIGVTLGMMLILRDKIFAKKAITRKGR